MCSNESKINSNCTVQVLTPGELLCMREAGKVAASILKKLRKVIQPGISTKDIEQFFDKCLKQCEGMAAAFKGFHGYPCSICVSVNEEVIHGIPNDRKKIKEGDVVSVDLGIEYKGLFVDTAYTYAVGRVSRLANKLIQITHKSLFEGIKELKAGSRIGDVGFAIQSYIEQRGFSVIRQFVGHGIGRQLHLPPEVPNFGEKSRGEEIKEGMVLAIEPMVSAGNFEVDILNDGWTAKTKDNSLSAHFEHTVAITNKGPWVLTK